MNYIIIITKKGKIKKVWTKEIRPMGRGAKGIKGIELDEGDEVVGIVGVEEKEKELL
jgi:DNA gyrase subunit A